MVKENDDMVLRGVARETMILEENARRRNYFQVRHFLAKVGIKKRGSQDTVGETWDGELLPQVNEFLQWGDIR